MAMSSRVVLEMNPDAGEDTRKAFRRSIGIILGKSQAVAKKSAPADTGQTRNSIHIFRKRPLPTFEGGIVTNLLHAVVMEQGVKPRGKFGPFRLKRIRTKTGKTRVIPKVGYPSIIAWVRRKFGLTGQMGVSRAFQVAWGLHRRGIAPRKFFAKGFKTMKKETDNQIRLLGDQVVKIWEKRRRIEP